MAYLQVADSRDGLQLWRVAANILKKHSQTADTGWPYSLTTPDRKKNMLVTKCLKETRNGAESLDKRTKLSKIDTRFGTWNVRNFVENNA
jgi:hypothetical protein